MTKYTIGLMAMVAMVVTALAAPSFSDDAPASVASVDHDPQGPPIDFSGQMVLLTTRMPGGLEGHKGTYVFVQPRLAQIGGRWFLTGKTVSSPNKRIFKYVSELGIAWENVVEFSTFTPEQFKKFTSEAMQGDAAE